MQTKFNIGDKVKIHPDHAGKWINTVWTIEKFLTTNVEMSHAWSTKRMRCAPELLIAADTDPESLKTHLTPVFEPLLYNGTLVLYKYKGQEQGLYVVIGNHAGKYRIVKLGGDHGKYFTRVARSQLTVVDPADFIK